MRLLIVDNYDSFTYNLVQYLGELGAEVEVVRNDEADVDTLMGQGGMGQGVIGREGTGREQIDRGGIERAADGLVISPGPGTPDDAGVSMAAIERFSAAGVPVLGVCLGHQSIGQVFGGHIVRARSIMHGKISTIEHDGKGVFEGLPQNFEATRYHSLVIEEVSLPEVLEITARTEDGEIMGVRHRSLAVEGVQFHPESIMTGEGKRLLGNFLAKCRAGAS